MTPAELAQAQLDAYNTRDLAAFLACYAEDVKVYRPPAAEPTLNGKAALGAHYAANRFSLPQLHAKLLGRLVVGNKVVDHERVHGVRAEPFEVIATYEVRDGLIAACYFFDAQ
jgi:hypothetical protein